MTGESGNRRRHTRARILSVAILVLALAAQAFARRWQ